MCLVNCCSSASVLHWHQTHCKSQQQLSQHDISCLLLLVVNESRDLRIGNFRSNRITNWIGVMIRIRVESRIESGCSHLCVQCWLPQELCSTTAYYRELPYYMLRCKVIVNVMVVSCIRKHKINLSYKLHVQQHNSWSFFVELWVWFVVRLQVRLIRKFRIGPSLSNRIGIVRFEFESNFKALQVPKWKLYNKNSY